MMVKHGEVQRGRRTPGSLPHMKINGKPSFQLLPLKDDEDLIDRLIEKHPGFRQMLQRRLGEKTVSLTEARRRLGQSKATSL